MNCELRLKSCMIRQSSELGRPMLLFPPLLLLALNQLLLCQQLLVLPVFLLHLPDGLLHGPPVVVGVGLGHVQPAGAQTETLGVSRLVVVVVVIDVDVDALEPRGSLAHRGCEQVRGGGGVIGDDVVVVFPRDHAAGVDEEGGYPRALGLGDAVVFAVHRRHLVVTHLQAVVAPDVEATPLERAHVLVGGELILSLLALELQRGHQLGDHHRARCEGDGRERQLPIGVFKKVSIARKGRGRDRLGSSIRRWFLTVTLELRLHHGILLPVRQGALHVIRHGLALRLFLLPSLDVLLRDWHRGGGLGLGAGKTLRPRRGSQQQDRRE